MRKNLFLFAILFAVVLIVSCANNDGNEADVNAAWTYSSSSPMYKVGSSVASLTISGLTSGVSNLYLVKLNTGSTAISAASTGCIYSTTGISSSSTNVRSAAALETLSSASSGQIVNFIPPEDLNPADVAESLTGSRDIVSNGNTSASRSACASTTTVATTTDSSEYTVGATKSLYVDQDSDISTFAEKQATLYAKGTHCYVWIVDDYYNATASGDKVNATVAEAYANKFDELYPMITNVFGYESDLILKYNGSTLSKDSMSSYDTGTMVNIVIYDIAKDYSASSGSTSGIVGYFYSKDYYAVTSSSSKNSAINYSNKGKYFYVDSYFANAYLDVTYSTLAHEFQHMINFGMKEIAHNVQVPATWYNENAFQWFGERYDARGQHCHRPMMISPKLGFYHSPILLRERSYRFRYPQALSAILRSVFNGHTLLVRGLADGMAVQILISKIMTNSYVDKDSIATAVSEVTGTTVDVRKDILESYVPLSCVSKITALQQPTFNQAAKATVLGYVSLTYTGNGYAYPHGIANQFCGTGRTGGRQLLVQDKRGACAPCHLHQAASKTLPAVPDLPVPQYCTASSDTVTLSITEPDSSNEELLIMVE